MEYVTVEFYFDKTRDINEAKNKIIELFKNFEVQDLKAKDETIYKLMRNSDKIKQNKIAQAARGLYSLPGMISTFIISPVLLGVLIPMLTYYNTRKAHEKMAQQNN